MLEVKKRHWIGWSKSKQKVKTLKIIYSKVYTHDVY